MEGMVERMNYLDFFNGKRILVTGHTGFKGTWLCSLLIHKHAVICGYSHQEYKLFQICRMSERLESVIGDIRDHEMICKTMNDFQPEIVIHMAAQPLVIESYHNPRYTYDVNMMGTVNLLDAVRRCKSVKAVVNVTTDKVYENSEWYWGYRENDRLCGTDPYSNSKSCAELITAGYRNSFFGADKHPAYIATARAGNVIGGGDFSKNRIIPDCIRAAKKGETIIVRNKDSIRPWQHVLEPLTGYLLLAQALYEHKCDETAFNFGPDDSDCINVGTLVDLFCTAWGENAKWECRPTPDAVHEARLLKLDCSLAHNVLGWHPKWNIRHAIEKCVEWEKNASDEDTAFAIMEEQIISNFSNAT